MHHSCQLFISNGATFPCLALGMLGCKLYRASTHANTQVAKRKKLETIKATPKHFVSSRHPSHDKAIRKERKISKMQINSWPTSDTESQDKLCWDWGVRKGTADAAFGEGMQGY